MKKSLGTTLGKAIKNPFVLGAVLIVLVLLFTYYVLFSTTAVSGNIIYDNAEALPEGSRLVIQIRDVSYQDTASRLIAEQIIENPGASPVGFNFSYDRDEISDKAIYSLSASIVDSSGELLFISDTAYNVITQDNPRRVDISLVGVPSNESDESQSNIETDTPLPLAI